MTDSAPLRTLFHPFDTGDLDPPGRDARTLLLGAVPGFRLPQGFAATIDCVSGFRPDFLALQRAGHSVTPEPEGGGYDLTLVLAGRHRGLNEARLADAWSRTRAGGMILVAGGKEDGIDSLRMRAAACVSLDGHLSKFHGVAFWLTRADAPCPFPQPEPAGIVAGRFATAPGMFSHDRVDAGSALLAECLPERISGDVADFGAGWGYLSAEVLSRADDLRALDLYEADHAALEAARSNLEDRLGETVLGFHWLDLLSEPVARRYDLVVMNPPFHQGRAADPAIGQGMIAAAAKALKPGGRLLMVANSGLPYEKTIAALFRRQEEARRESGFKVIAAER